MAEADRYLFEFTELAEILVKQQGVRTGYWGVYFEIGFTAANVPGPDGKTIMPAAVNFIQKVGLQKFPAANNLTVDAAVVNPSPAGIANPRRPGGRRATGRQAKK